MEIRAVVFQLRSQICGDYSIYSPKAHGSGPVSVEEKIPSLIPLTISRSISLSPWPIPSQFQSVLRGIGSTCRHELMLPMFSLDHRPWTVSAMVQLLRTARDTALHPPPSPHRLSMPCPLLSCHRLTGTLAHSSRAGLLIS